MSESDTRQEVTTSKRDLLVLRVIDRLSGLFAYGAAAGVILLIANIFIDVAGRKLFNTPFPGTLAHTTYWWMPTLALLAFGYTEKQQEHIKVTVLLDALPLRMRQIVEGIFSLLATGLLLCMMYYAWTDAMKSYGYQQVTPSDPPVAIWPFKFVAVVGMGMIALQMAATTIRYFAGTLPATAAYDNEADIG